MKKMVLILSTLLLSAHAQAGEMEDAYQRAISGSSVHNEKALSGIQQADTSKIVTDVPQISYKHEMGSAEEGKSFALTQSEVKDEYNKAVSALSFRKPVDNNLLDNAESISKNADKYIGSDGYCRDGACYEPESVEHNDMIQSAAVLEDVLGGGQSYSESGEEARVYTGNAQHCKSGDSLNALDCCKDKGWFKKFGLGSCSSDDEKLADMRESGRCHYVGKYKKNIKGPLGTKIGWKEYKGYCCFSSKMARVTQEGAKPQLSLSWGSAKHPSCQGLTSDQFAGLDFSIINMSEIYTDIESSVVIPSQGKMLKKPGEYIADQEIASW